MLKMKLDVLFKLLVLFFENTDCLYTIFFSFNYLSRQLNLLKISKLEKSLFLLKIFIINRI